MATEKKKFKEKVNDRIDKELDHALAVMAKTDPTTKEYLVAAAAVERLQKLKDARRFMPSSDAILSAGVTIGCVVAIMVTELNGGLFTTKALNFLPKLRF